MKAFSSQLYIQFRGDLRDKGVLMVYYLVPLAFYFIMGSIFTLPEISMGNSVITSITIFAISMSSYLGMPQSLVKARENGILQAYRVAGIPAWSLPLAAIIISFVHMLIIASIILLSAPFVFNAAWPGSIPLHFVSMALVILSSQALGTLLACFVKKQNTLTLVGQCLFLPTVLMSGIMFPTELLPKAMRIIGTALPATQGAKLVLDGTIQAGPLIILISITMIAFTLSALLFRRISTKK